MSNFTANASFYLAGFVNSTYQTALITFSATKEQLGDITAAFNQTACHGAVTLCSDAAPICKGFAGNITLGFAELCTGAKYTAGQVVNITGLASEPSAANALELLESACGAAKLALSPENLCTSDNPNIPESDGGAKVWPYFYVALAILCFCVCVTDHYRYRCKSYYSSNRLNRPVGRANYESVSVGSR